MAVTSSSPEAGVVTDSPAYNTQYDDERRKEEGAAPRGMDDDHSGSDSDEPFHKDAQAGVQDIEVATTVWSKSALIFAYVWIWVIYFVDTTQQGATSSLTPWVTSAFQQHSLTPTVNIMSNIIGGVSKLTLAKILDVLGRPTGYLLTIILTTLGLVLMATCNGVEMYAAAQVFFWVGYNGLGFCLGIFIADTSSLKNRGLMFAYANSPYISMFHLLPSSPQDRVTHSPCSHHLARRSHQRGFPQRPWLALGLRRLLHHHSRLYPASLGPLHALPACRQEARSRP
jgi:hypothetical protein